jgi:hypothetical protein
MTKDNDKDTTKIFNEISQAIGVIDKDSITVEYTVIYWRKSNQIHGYFVNTFAEGEDRCQTISVPRDGLVKLLDICTQLLDTYSTEMAMELLPPMSGFFFGNYDIDEYYWGDIKHTFDELSTLLNENPDHWSINYNYQSSW